MNCGSAKRNSRKQEVLTRLREIAQGGCGEKKVDACSRKLKSGLMNWCFMEER